MPIRFRCAYCSQLMGISRRKAGTVVSCPKCRGQVVVPHPAPGDEAEPAADTGTQPLFEGSDFDNVFGGSSGEAAVAPLERSPGLVVTESAPIIMPGAPSPLQELKTEREIDFQVGPPNAAPAHVPSGPGPGRPGVWLSPTAIALLCLLAIVFLALAFVGGLLVGRSLGR